MEFLRLEDLSIAYETPFGLIHATTGVNFDVRRGESVCLVGESGSGKSTVGLAIAMALPPNARVMSGRILYGGVDLLRLSEEERKKYSGREVSIVFQDPAATLNPLFTIGEQISDVLMSNLGLRKDEALNRARKFLEIVGLPDSERVLKSFPHELSGGMLQRVNIAIAISTEPKVLVADEPTTMLDVILQAQILELFEKLKRELKLTLIFITHNLGVASEVCDRIIVMYAGTIVEDGPADEVISRPMHPYTIGLLDCVPRAHIRDRKLRSIPGSLPDLSKPLTHCPFADRCEEVREICTRAIPTSIDVNPGHRVSCFKYIG
ncbi:MAG: ABC transporter ATP-binding protein [Candidatus Korarchaeum sp.]|jgi:oligopeptide/dipeptide ABC transporter ATP-binding protein|nr:ABC transporter ATP-binding protein [Candidatus Korarchaeum sp.]